MPQLRRHLPGDPRAARGFSVSRRCDDGKLLRSFPTTGTYGEPRRTELSDEDVLQLKRCTPARSEAPTEVRHEPRYSIAAPVTVLSLEDDFRIVGVPATAYTIDVSCGGLSLLHPESTTAPYFAVDFSPSSLRIAPVIFQPRRCSRLGGAFPVAGRFVCRVNYLATRTIERGGTWGSVFNFARGGCGDAFATNDYLNVVPSAVREATAQWYRLLGRPKWLTDRAAANSSKHADRHSSDSESE